MALGIIGLAVLAFTNRGAFLGLVLVAAMNGVPFVDTSKLVISKYTLQDAVVSVLILVAVAWIILDSGSYRPTRVGRAISRAGFVLLAWWCITVTRTVVADSVPLLRAIAYGRDFLDFALILILLPRVRLTGRDMRIMIVPIAAAVCLFAVGQITTAVGGAFPSSLIHIEHTIEQSGLTRVYAKMTDLVNAALAVAIGAALLARRLRSRYVALAFIALLTVSVVVQLTRARWIGLTLGVIAVSLWFVTQNRGRISILLRTRLARALCITLLIGTGVVIVTPGVLSNGTFLDRLTSTFSSIENGSGTVAVRETASRTVTRYVGGEWPVGIGFVPPSSHYFVGLREGSIRDTDLGVLNAVATMGVVGAIIIYIPVVLVLLACLRSRYDSRREYDWLRYGGAIWILAVLSGSVTLVTLFSISGLSLTAVFLTVLAHPSVLGRAASNDAARLREARNPRSGLARRHTAPATI